MSQPTPLTICPQVWDQVDPQTVAALIQQFQTIANTTTPATTMAALITTLAFAIADGYDVRQWGPLAYDASLHLQNSLLQEMLHPAGPQPVVPAAPDQDVIAPPLVPVAEPVAEPEPLPSKFSAGVGPAPGGTR